MTTIALPFGRAPDVVDDVRGVEMTVVGQVLDVADRRVALQLVDVARATSLRSRGVDCGSSSCQHLAQIADERRRRP